MLFRSRLCCCSTSTAPPTAPPGTALCLEGGWGSGGWDLEGGICSDVLCCVCCSIPGDLQGVVYRAGAQTDAGWDFLLQAYGHASDAAEKRRLLRALASTQDARRIAW